MGRRPAAIVTAIALAVTMAGCGSPAPNGSPVPSRCPAPAAPRPPGNWRVEPLPLRTDGNWKLNSVAAGRCGGVWAFSSRNTLVGSNLPPKVYPPNVLAAQAVRRDPDGRWHEVKMPTTEAPTPGPSTWEGIGSAVVFSDTDVWPESPGGGGLLHWDGERWSWLSVVPGRQLQIGGLAEVGGQLWATAVDISISDVTKEVLLRWDGHTWLDTGVPVPLTDRTTNEDSYTPRLVALGGTGPGDVWEFGYALNPGPAPPSPESDYFEAVHWDGVRWTKTALPAPELLELNDLVAITANDVWAVGLRRRTDRSSDTAVTMHWDGTAWSEIAVPDPFKWLDRVTVVGTEVWAFDVRDALRYVGGGWQPVRDVPMDSIISGATLSDGRPIVIGKDAAGHAIAAVGGR